MLSLLLSRQTLGGVLKYPHLIPVLGTAKKKREAKLAKAFNVLVLAKEIFDHLLDNIFSSLSIILWY
jgi:hypothetical protein